MVSQMILPPESLPANITTVRPLVRMGPLVDQQVVALRKLPIAKFTYELFFRSHRALLPPQRYAVS